MPATWPIVAGREAKPIAIRLEKGRSVSGSVVDHDGKPISDVMVHFQLGDNDPEDAVAARADAEGRFRLDGVPDDPGSLLVAREGTLSRVMDGCHSGRIPSIDGHFRMEWVNWTWCKELHAAIEADGPAFTGWPTVPAPSGPGHREVTLDFQVKRAASVVCVVRAADGSPVADAKIGSGTPRNMARLRMQFRLDGVHLRANTDTYAPMTTDRDGRFTLAPIEGSDWMVIAHPRGVAVVETGPIRAGRASPAEITLQPWGRIEGTLRVGNKPGAHERIALYFSEPGAAPAGLVRS